MSPTLFNRRVRINVRRKLNTLVELKTIDDGLKARLINRVRHYEIQLAATDIWSSYIRQLSLILGLMLCLASVVGGPSILGYSVPYFKEKFLQNINLLTLLVSGCSNSFPQLRAEASFCNRHLPCYANHRSWITRGRRSCQEVWSI